MKILVLIQVLCVFHQQTNGFWFSNLFYDKTKSDKEKSKGRENHIANGSIDGNSSAKELLRKFSFELYTSPKSLLEFEKITSKSKEFVTSTEKSIEIQSLTSKSNDISREYTHSSAISKENHTSNTKVKEFVSSTEKSRRSPSLSSKSNDISKQYTHSTATSKENQSSSWKSNVGVKEFVNSTEKSKESPSSSSSSKSNDISKEFIISTEKSTRSSSLSSTSNDISKEYAHSTATSKENQSSSWKTNARVIGFVISTKKPKKIPSSSSFSRSTNVPKEYVTPAEKYTKIQSFSSNSNDITQEYAHSTVISKENHSSSWKSIVTAKEFLNSTEKSKESQPSSPSPSSKSKDISKEIVISTKTPSSYSSYSKSNDISKEFETSTEKSTKSYSSFFKANVRSEEFVRSTIKSEKNQRRSSKPNTSLKEYVTWTSKPLRGERSSSSSKEMIRVKLDTKIPDVARVRFVTPTVLLQKVSSQRSSSQEIQNIVNERKNTNTNTISEIFSPTSSNVFFNNIITPTSRTLLKSKNTLKNKDWNQTIKDSINITNTTLSSLLKTSQLSVSRSEQNSLNSSSTNPQRSTASKIELNPKVRKSKADEFNMKSTQDKFDQKSNGIIQSVDISGNKEKENFQVEKPSLKQSKTSNPPKNTALFISSTSSYQKKEFSTNPIEEERQTFSGKESSSATMDYSMSFNFRNLILNWNKRLQTSTFKSTTIVEERSVLRNPSSWLKRNSFQTSSSFDPVCTLPKDEGVGSETISSWYYNSISRQCEWFIYRGKEGNGNRFNYRANCENYCIQTYPDFCSRLDIVNCVETWLKCKMEFDQYCNKEAYTNRKASESYCPPRQPICISRSGVFRKPPEYLTHQQMIPRECTEEQDPGKCLTNSNSVLVYHYDRRYNDCLGFLYSKCGGNSNRFSNKAECMNHCAI